MDRAYACAQTSRICTSTCTRKKSELLTHSSTHAHALASVHALARAHAFARAHALTRAHALASLHAAAHTGTCAVLTATSEMGECMFPIAWPV
eukprot:2425415-Pleurochrysis_carterae.AAC.3